MHVMCASRQVTWPFKYSCSFPHHALSHQCTTAKWHHAGSLEMQACKLISRNGESQRPCLSGVFAMDWTCCSISFSLSSFKLFSGRSMPFKSLRQKYKALATHTTHPTKPFTLLREGLLDVQPPCPPHNMKT